MRIELFIEDFNICNLLGAPSKRNKIKAVYLTINNLNYFSQCRGKNFEVVQLMIKDEASKHDLRIFYSRIIDCLNSLYVDGIKIERNGIEYEFKCFLAMICADNPASHEIGNLSTCFSGGSICRYCDARYDQIQTVFDAEQFTLWTKATEQPKLDEILRDDKMKTVYGLNGPNVFDSLIGFDFFMSSPPDVMHDIQEGVIPLIMQCLLAELSVANIS